MTGLLVWLFPASGHAAQAKNVILFIGDGMGFEQVKAARYYNGAPLSFQGLPYQAQVTTYSANSGVTDSAAAGTAIATGTKVNNYVVSMAYPGDGSDLKTSLEISKDLGKKVGLITTTYLTHATPATFGAHAADRNSTSEIASDYLYGSKPNILFGGGGNGLTPASTRSVGYVVAEDTASFNALSTSANLLSAQFGTTYLPYEYDYLGKTYPCPHLSDMVAKALAALGPHTDGFFLMVEGGMIDQACHGNKLQASIHETLELGRAVQVALNWAATRTDTLILVTADHETGGLTVTQDKGAGNYPTVTWSTTGHTAANVPVYAWGQGAAAVSGILDNTDLHKLCVGEPIPVLVTLVEAGSTWKYEASGTYLQAASIGTPATDWKSTVYNDSLWPSGPAQLGYGDGDEKTLLPSTPVRSCYYFRHSFYVEDPAAYADLSLRILRDDGAVVYLNGTEVARYSMPEGPITFATWASTASEYDWDPSAAIPNQLIEGWNVLAVEIHQSGSTSSDISLDLALTAKRIAPDLTPPLISDLQASQITDRSALITWTTQEPADSRVDFNWAPDGAGTVSDPALVTQHSIPLTGLSANTAYSYTVTSADGAGNSSESLGNFTTEPANVPPTASDLTVETTEDTRLNLSLEGSDGDGDSLSFRIVTSPEHGTLSGTAPNLQYTPAPNYSGLDSFNYVANDGQYDSLPAEVAITVTAVNDPPSKPALSAAPGDQEVALKWTDSLDPDGDSVTYEVLRRNGTGGAYAPLTDALSPTITSYTDRSVENGTTYEYVVRATAGGDTADSQPVSVTPVAPDYNAYVTGNPTLRYGILSGDFTNTRSEDTVSQTLTEVKSGLNADLDAEYVLRTIADPARIETLTLNLVGGYTDYADPLKVFVWHRTQGWVDISTSLTPTRSAYNLPDPQQYVNASGEIRIWFTDSVAVRKEKLDVLTIDHLYAQITLSGSVTPNQPPVANPDSDTTAAGTPVTINLLANDSDPDGNTITLTGAESTTANSGKVLLNTETVTYTPADGFTGDDSFTYTISDGNGGTATGTVTVTVTVTPSTGDTTVSVSAISMSAAVTGKNLKANALVTIVNQSQSRMPGATVVGDWRFNGNVLQSGATLTTDAQGNALFVSPPVNKTSIGTFTFQVMDVSLAGAAYIPSSSATASLTVP